MLALASAAACVSSAFGYTVALSPGSYQSGIGGEFTATVNDDSLDAYLGTYGLSSTGNAVANTFQTFCIEYQEHFSYNTPYTADVSGAAKLGGTLTQDIVSVGTGWLYSQFAQGLLTTTTHGSYFTGSAIRKTQAGQLQNAIWWLEGEITTSQAANPFIIAASTFFGIAPAATVPTASPSSGGLGLAGDSLGTYSAAGFGVYALNLGPLTSGATKHQDQLIFKATGNREVPDGGTTLLLLGMTVTGMGALQRKMRKPA